MHHDREETNRNAHRKADLKETRDPPADFLGSNFCHVGRAKHGLECKGEKSDEYMRKKAYHRAHGKASDEPPAIYEGELS